MVIHLPGVLEAAREVQGLCEREGFRFCFIGGVAVQRWGEPRLTQDVDLTVLTGFGQEEQHVDSLLAALSPRRGDAREFALRHRVLLLRTAAGVDVDVALGAFPFEERSVDRASHWSWTRGSSLLTFGRHRRAPPRRSARRSVSSDHSQRNAFTGSTLTTRGAGSVAASSANALHQRRARRCVAASVGATPNSSPTAGAQLSTRMPVSRTLSVTAQA